jgi:tRNA(adenine34) deaminase
VQGGLMADACGQVLRDFFAERRAQQKAERLLSSIHADADPRDDDVIPAGEATEVQMALPLDPFSPDSPST